jgi:hypothetical protein
MTPGAEKSGVPEARSPTEIVPGDEYEVSQTPYGTDILRNGKLDGHFPEGSELGKGVLVSQTPYGTEVRIGGKLVSFKPFRFQEDTG